MRKLVIFNIGGALASYIEIDDKKIMIDIGAGNDFSPVDDFLIPLSKKRKFKKTEEGKYYIDQLFLSHLDNDHISDFSKFNDRFAAQLLTVPNNHPDILEHLKIDVEKINFTNNVKEIFDNIKKRTPGIDSNNPTPDNPLGVCCDNFFKLFYIDPNNAEKIDQVSDEQHEQYANNVSLVIYLNVDGKSVLFSGDIMNNGMQYLIENNIEFKSILKNEGINFLIAPHHGLDTSFPNSLFNTIKGGKVNLTIISEKEIKKNEKENRHNVDSRYYSPDFSEGYSISNSDQDRHFATITSKNLGTHILIDLETNLPVIKKCSIEELLNEFNN